MAPQTPQQGGSGTESSRTIGASSNTPPAETQLQPKPHLFHRNAATAASQTMTLDAYLKFDFKSGSGNDNV